MLRLLSVFAFSLLTFLQTSRAAELLPSWNDGPSKKAIVEFVGKVTQAGGVDYVPLPSELPCSTMMVRCGPSNRCTSSSRSPWIV